MKKCPYCAEGIQDEAIVCRYCGRDLPPPAPLEAQSSAEPDKSSKPESRATRTWLVLATVLTVVLECVAVYSTLAKASQYSGFMNALERYERKEGISSSAVVFPEPGKICILDYGEPCFTNSELIARRIKAWITGLAVIGLLAAMPIGGWISLKRGRQTVARLLASAPFILAVPFCVLDFLALLSY